MSDKKISQLPSSATPLAGTEEFAIVQSGDTKKSTLNNLFDRAVVFNESGADVDFRIESDTSAHAFFLDAGNNRIGINNPSPLNTVDIAGDLRADAFYMFDNESIFLGNGGILKIYNDGSSSIIRSQGEPLNIDANGITFRGYSPYTSLMTIASTGDVTISNGNLVIGTSGKGIDTSAAHPVTFAINSSEAARIHASKGVSIGNTVDPGVNNLSVTGGITNANIKTGNGLLTNNLSAPEIMFSAAGQGIYIVFAYIEAYDPNDWSAQATVTSSGGGALKLTAVNNAGMEITVSGTDVLCQQIGGGGSPLGTKYVYQKII